MADAPKTISFGSAPIATPVDNAPKTLPFGSKPVVAPSVAAPVETDTPGFGSKVGNFFKGLYNYSKGVLDAGADPVKEAANKVIADVQGQNGSLISGLSKGVDVAGDIAGGVAKEFGGLFNAAIIKPIASVVSESPTLQHDVTTEGTPESNLLNATDKAHAFLTEKWNTFEAAHPDAAKKIADTGNIAQFMSLFIGDNPDVQVKGADIVSKVSDTASQAAEAAKNAAAKVEVAAKEVPTIVSDATDATKTMLENRYVSKTIDDWERVGGDYVKTDKLLAREQAQIENPNAPKAVQDTPTFLAEHGISPTSLIKEGKFDTSSIAEKLTGEAIKPFEDTLTAQLKVAQQGQPPVSLSEAETAVYRNIDNIRNITEGDRVLMKNAADRDIAALRAKYPDGIPLDELNIQKGSYWKNTKFDVSRPLQSQVNYQIGSAFKDIIEVKAGDADVRELNAVLGNYYKAGKFLDGLNGKLPKLTLGQKIVRGVTKGVLTGVGEKLFGLEGGVGGFLLSKSVSQILENASNPLKALILNNLKTSDPAAYTQAIKWLGEKEAERLSRPLLEAPGEQGSSKNPIITPAPKEPTVIEKPAEKINRQDSKPGETISQVMERARAKGELDNFLNEPYIPTDELPVIEAGAVPKKKSDLPTIK